MLRKNCSIIGFIKNFFNIAPCGLSDTDKNEQIRIAKMLYTLMVLGIVLLVVMGIILYIEGDYFYSTLDLIISIIIMGLVFLLRSGIGLTFCSILCILLIQFFFMFLFHSGAGDQMAFIWYYLFPLVTLFLLGTGLGTFFSLLMIGLSIMLNSLAERLTFIIPYSSPVLIRIVLSYLGVLLFAFVFEKTRMSTHRKLNTAMNEMNELAIRDGLTGLYNRRYMDVVVKNIIQQFSRSGSAVGFIMADLDFFKKYNDTYGHQAGDNLLRQFSDMLTSMQQRKSDYIFRYGGEEFAFLLPSANIETAEKFASLIVDNTFDLNIPHSSHPLGRVTVSVGVSFIVFDYNNFDHNRKIEELVDTADKALYEAKKSGRNGFVLKTLQEEVL